MPQTVLIDDSSRFRAAAREVLEAAGYGRRHVVAEASDGESGIAAVTAATPDLALVDVQLPGIDGCEVSSATGRGWLRGRDRPASPAATGPSFGSLVEASGAQRIRAEGRALGRVARGPCSTRT